MTASKNYTRVGSILDGNLTAIEIYHDRWRGDQVVYIAINKTNTTFTMVH